MQNRDCSESEREWILEHLSEIPVDNENEYVLGFPHLFYTNYFPATGAEFHWIVGKVNDRWYRKRI